MQNRPRPRFLALVTVALALCAFLLTACGGVTATNPAPTEPSPTDPSIPPTISDIRFDFTGAIGLQIGGATGSGIETASIGSNLIKVLADGTLRDSLADGSVVVRDFFLRNGNVYALFEPYDPQTGETTTCVLAQIDPDGATTCIDADLAEIDVRTIQFDAYGGIYYRGILNDGSWRTVIRRYSDGATRDYYRADDATYIERFVVTREGLVIAAGSSSGTIGSTYWLRLLGDEESGVIGRDLTLSQGTPTIFGFLPDGSLLVSREGTHGMVPWRWMPEDQQWDVRAYMDTANARFRADGIDQWTVWSAAERSYSSAEAMFGVSSNGVLMIFPELRYLELPITQVTNAELRANMAVVSGLDGTTRRALLVDLRTESYVDMLAGRDIDVLRVKIELDRERVILYGLDIGRNQPVLATYDVVQQRLDLADVEQLLAESFEVIDWRVQHVPPERWSWTPEPTFEWQAGSDLDARRIAFSAAAMPNLAFIDAFEWDFGDGSEPVRFTAEDLECYSESTNVRVCRGSEVSQDFAVTGTYTTRLTVTNDIGLVGTITVNLEVEVPEVVGAALTDWGASIVWTANGEYYGSGTLGAMQDERQWTTLQLPLDWIAGAMPTDTAAIGNEFLMAVNGALYVWGENDNGQLGTGDRNSVPNPTRLEVAGEPAFVKVATGGLHSLAVDSEGRLFGWGNNAYGQVGPTGVGTFILRPMELAVEDAGPFADVAAGDCHSLALTASGTVYSFGCTWTGALGRSGAAEVPLPVEFTDGTAVIRSIESGLQHSVALGTDGALYAWGRNTEGQVGIGDRSIETISYPTRIETGATVALIAAAGRQTLAATTDGALYGWGANSTNNYALGLGTTTYQESPTVINIDDDHPVIAVVAGTWATFVLTESGRLHVAGYDFGRFGLGPNYASYHRQFTRIR